MYLCSKKGDDTVTPPVVIHNDTLTAGWAKRLVGTSSGFTDIVS